MTRIEMVVFLLVVSLGCSSCSGGSEANRAFAACVDRYNDTYRYLPSPKAMASGVSEMGTRCYWRWDQSTPDEAVSGTLADCGKSYDRCFLFDENGNEPSWVRQIEGKPAIAQPTQHLRGEALRSCIRECGEMFQSYSQGFQRSQNPSLDGLLSAGHQQDECMLQCH